VIENEALEIQYLVRDNNDTVIFNQPIPTGRVILPGDFAVFATTNLPNDSVMVGEDPPQK